VAGTPQEASGITRFGAWFTAMGLSNARFEQYSSSKDPTLACAASTHQRRSHPMTDKTADKAKGRVKEAAGALTGDKSLKNEGRVDQAKGKVKDAVDKVADGLTGRNKK
jgi:uncharacterized protein YjbJ (UPF0337 family)